MADVSTYLKQILGGGGGASLPQGAGGGPVPVPQPRPVAPGSTAQPASPASNTGGFDWRTFMHDFTAGAAQPLDYRANPFNAFSQGYQGAANAEKERLDKARKIKLQDEDRSARTDDRAFNRRLAEGREGRAGRAETRADESHELGRIKSITDIMRNMGGGMTTDQKLRLENTVSDFGRALAQSGALDETEIRSQMDAYRTQLEQRLGGGSAPAQPGAPAQTAPTPASAPTGAGTQSDPIKIENSRAAYDALPSGAYFIHPQTGQLRRKN